MFGLFFVNLQYIGKVRVVPQKGTTVNLKTK
jgi:hypothetical protein